LRERDDLFCDLAFGLSSKDKREASFVFLEMLSDIRDIMLDCRNLLFQMNYVDDEGNCCCPSCVAEREKVDIEEQEKIEVFHPDPKLIDELFEQENGKEE